MPAATNDNTTVPATGTGDKLRTDAATTDDGDIVKTPVVKIATGDRHETPKLVTEYNPFPVHDKVIYLLLTEILSVLKEILQELRGRRR